MRAALRLTMLAAAFAALVVPSAQGSPPLSGVNFISVCGFSHRGPDDPIVYPGMPGLSHDHTFVGNTSTNANSTPATLRASTTTCKRPGDTAAYWAPTLLVSGRYDEATPRIVGEIHERIPGSEWALFEESSHMPHVEEPEAFLERVEEFLRSID